MASEPIIVDSARKLSVADEDIPHAFNHPIRAEDLDNDMTMLVGPDRSANLLEVGVVTGPSGPVIIHAMPARPKYLRRR